MYLGFGLKTTFQKDDGVMTSVSSAFVRLPALLRAAWCWMLRGGQAAYKSAASFGFSRLWYLWMDAYNMEASPM